MLVLLSAAAVVIAVDQVAKQLVVSWLREGEVARETSFLRVRRITNVRGGGRSVFSAAAFLFIWALTFVAIALLVAIGPLFQDGASRTGLGFAIGGATGNLADRLWRRGVVDFIDVGFWPVFNVADLAIVFGVGLALWYIN